MGLKEIYKVANYYDVKYGFNKEADVAPVGQKPISDPKTTPWERGESVWFNHKPSKDNSKGWLYETFIGYPKGSWESLKDNKAFKPNPGQKLFSVTHNQNMVWDGGEWTKETEIEQKKEQEEKDRKYYATKAPYEMTDDEIVALHSGQKDMPKSYEFNHYRPYSLLDAAKLYKKVLEAWKNKQPIDPNTTPKNINSPGPTGMAYTAKKPSGSSSSLYMEAVNLRDLSKKNSDFKPVEDGARSLVNSWGKIPVSDFKSKLSQLKAMYSSIKAEGGYKEKDQAAELSSTNKWIPTEL
jgi:hypothetical protein